MRKPKTKLSRLGEFSWLQHLLPRLFWPKSTYPQLLISPGDDAGVLRITSGRALVATTDAMVEGIHFETRWFSWRSLGEKILSVNLSDLAAMGDVKPLAALVTAAIPGNTPVQAVDNFYQGLDNCARRWKTGLLGGDTVGSKKGWFVSIALLGEANPRHLVRRQGAGVGDYIVSSGPLGLAAAGLDVLQTGKKQWAWTRPLVEAFSSPQPRFKEGALLGRNHWATSLIDCSDGLEASVRLLSEASKLGAQLDLEALPIPPALQRWADYRNRPAWTYALRGGEDYELIFTVKPSLWPKVIQTLPLARAFGTMTAIPGQCKAHIGLQQIVLTSRGYDHFSG